jgi:hypothetical protein
VILLLVIGGTIAAALAAIVLLARGLGRQEARLATAREMADVRQRQLEASNRRPRDDGELVDRLRSGGF